MEHITTLISVITENRPGVLAEIADVLGSANININAINGEGLGEIGIIRLITDDHKKTAEILQKKNYNIVESDVFEITVPNKPGQLKKISDVLVKKKINIEFIYQQTSEDRRSARIIIKVDERKKLKARELFEKEGFFD